MRAVSPLSSVAPAPSTPDCCTCMHGQSGVKVGDPGVETVADILRGKRSHRHYDWPPISTMQTPVLLGRRSVGKHCTQGSWARSNWKLSRECIARCEFQRPRKFCHAPTGVLVPRSLHPLSAGGLWTKQAQCSCAYSGGAMAVAMLSGPLSRLTLSRAELRPSTCSHAALQVTPSTG